MNSTATYPPEYLAEYVGRSVINTAILMGVFETLFIVLFFIARYRGRTINAVDAYLMIPAFLFSFSEVIISFIEIHYARVGHHWVTLAPHTMVTNLKVEIAVALLYPPAITFPKLSILCLYLRIFTTRGYRWATYTIFGILVVNLIVIEGVILGMCQPLAFQWNKKIPGGHCIDQQHFFVWASIPNIVTDVAILLLPLPLIYNLQVSKMQKLGLAFSILAGSLGTLTAILRFAFFYNVPLAKDLSFHGARLVVWTTVEPGVYLIAACLPSLRPLFKHAIESASVVSVRGRFQSQNSKANGSKNPSSAIALSAVERAKETSMGDRYPRTGFKRLDDPERSGDFD